MPLSRDRIRGMFLGVAIGDALGVPVETFDAVRIKHEFGRITTYIQNPTHTWSAHKPAGMWSDDTQLTLAVAESIIETGALDLENQAKWHMYLLDEFGDLGLGGSTRDALNRLRAGAPPTESGKTQNPKRGMGNALPMKSAPIGALFASQLRLTPVDGAHNTALWFRTVELVAGFTAMTHRTIVAVESALSHVYAVSHCLTTERPIDPGQFLQLASGAAANANDLSLPGVGDLADRLWRFRSVNVSALADEQVAALNGDDAFLVRNSLLVAYACFLRHHDSVLSLYEAIAAGGDTDTNASITGSLVGALKGASVFPDHLVRGLVHRDRILDTAERLCDRLGIEE